MHTHMVTLIWLHLICFDEWRISYRRHVFLTNIIIFEYLLYLYISIAWETQDSKDREALTWILPHHTYVAKVNTWILCELKFLNLRNRAQTGSRTRIAGVEDRRAATRPTKRTLIAFLSLACNIMLSDCITIWLGLPSTDRNEFCQIYHDVLVKYYVFNNYNVMSL